MNNKSTYEKEILKVIKDNNLFIITDIFTYYTGCSRKTFYDHKLHKSDTIKKAIDDNKIKTKHSLTNKWFNSGNFSSEIALYKLLSTKKELKKLSMNYQDVTSKGKKIKERRIGSVTINRPEE